MVTGDTGLLLRLQTEVLEAVACGEPLVAVADLLCRRAEALAPDAGMLKYYQTGGNTYVVASVDDDGHADFQIEIIGLHTLTAGNFILE